MRRPCLLEYPDSPLYLSRRRKAFRGTCVWFPYRSGTRPISSLPTRGRTPVTVFTISRRYLILLSWNEVRGEAHRRDGAGRWEMAQVLPKGKSWCAGDAGVSGTLKYRRYARGAKLQETSAEYFPGTVSHNQNTPRGESQPRSRRRRGVTCRQVPITPEPSSIFQRKRGEGYARLNTMITYRKYCTLAIGKSQKFNKYV